MMTLMVVSVLAGLFLLGAARQGINTPKPIRIPVEQQQRDRSARR